MSKVRSFVALALVAFVALALVLQPAGAGVRTPQIFDPAEENDCLEPYPAAVGVPVEVEAAGFGANVDVDLAVLLDGLTQADAEPIVAKAAESYEPLGITLKAASYESVSLSGTDVTPGNPNSLVQQSKDHFGGARPAGSDAVFLITTKNISVTAEVGPGFDPVSTDALLGIADCIGGIRYPNHAFGVAEVFEFDLKAFGVNFFPITTSLTLAHELGHLLGGHHHYADCVEGVPQAAVAVATTPCTLMFNDAELNSPFFGALNSAVVRGHAEEWAS